MKARVGGHSTLRAQKRNEYRAEMAKLTPSERLRMGLEFSEFCVKLAASGQKAIVHGSSPKSHHRTG